MKRKMLRAFLVGALLAKTLVAEAVEQNERPLDFPLFKGKPAPLPFPYASLEKKDRDQIKYIPERFFTVLQDNAPTKALVGPLQPCVFVGLRNEKEGKAVVFHKHFSNNIDLLIATARENLTVNNPGDIKGVLYTTHMVDYERPIELFYHGMGSMKQAHEGKTQLEELKFIKDKLIEAFKIKDRTQISATKFTSALPDGALGDYECAEVFVLGDSRLQLKSLCTMHEGFFGDFSALPLKERIVSTIRKQQEVTLELIDMHFFGKVTEKEINTYNTVPFKKL